MKGYYWSRKENKLVPSHDLTGKRFGKLTVIGLSDKKYINKDKLWECLCDCGNHKTVPLSFFKRGRSCGCALRKQKSLLGKRFGRLLVTKYCGKNKIGQFQWECLCDCGQTKTIVGYVLEKGNSHSCGCLRKEINKKNKNLRQRLKNGEAHRNSLYHTYRKRALEKSLEFNLTIEQFEKITKQNCYYCGAEPKERKFSNWENRGINGVYVGNGIDRVDNNLGYIEKNCVPCCEQCNSAKKKMKLTEFIEWVLKVAERIKNQKIFPNHSVFLKQEDNMTFGNII